MAPAAYSDGMAVQVCDLAADLDGVLWDKSWAYTLKMVPIQFCSSSLLFFILKAKSLIFIKYCAFVDMIINFI